jgi:hypothetical protein
MAGLIMAVLDEQSVGHCSVQIENEMRIPCGNLFGLEKDGILMIVIWGGRFGRRDVGR